MTTNTPVARSLTDDDLAPARELLHDVNSAFTATHPGEPTSRQPTHTVYGGAQLFRATTTQRMGQLALDSLATYAPDSASLARALRWNAHLTELAPVVYERVVAKLRREPIEDFRIDFEDGYGNRPADEEDAEAARCARELADGMRDGVLPPFIGIRVKPPNAELAERLIRTLDIFLTTLVSATDGALPDGFVVTIPKVVTAGQVTAICHVIEQLEQRLGLASGAVPIELMIETPQSVLDDDGRCNLPALVAAAGTRCRGVHFGTYDYTALCNITAAHQTMAHPSCDFAKHAIQVSMAQRGILISDGATNIMPVAPNRAAPGSALTPDQLAQNAEVVHNAWRIAHDHIRHSLVGGFYQGWDLHPAQLPIRYAATYAFFLESLAPATARLNAFLDKAAQATLLGDVFDDAATGQGLLNVFLRGIACGAVTEDEAASAGLTIEELRSRSFLAIIEGRRG